MGEILDTTCQYVYLISSSLVAEMNQKLVSLSSSLRSSACLQEGACYCHSSSLVHWDFSLSIPGQCPDEYPVHSNNLGALHFNHSPGLHLLPPPHQSFQWTLEVRSPLETRCPILPVNFLGLQVNCGYLYSTAKGWLIQI